MAVWIIKLIERHAKDMSIPEPYYTGDNANPWSSRQRDAQRFSATWVPVAVRRDGVDGTPWSVLKHTFGARFVRLRARY